MASPTSTTTRPGHASAKTDDGLSLPRLICLHGGGTNARIFHAQCRGLRSKLAPYFRLVFAQAPLPSRPGPDVASVFAEWGPFRSWLPMAVMDGEPCDVEATTTLIDQSIADAVCADNELGATGRVVGLLGFSQGARVAASLLLRQQRQQRHCNGNDGPMSDVAAYCFAVLMAGRGPLVRLTPIHGEPMAETDAQEEKTLLRLPTVHVHGMQDAGLTFHQELLEKHCDKSATRLVEWDGDHRLPIKTKDVLLVVAQILDVARATGCLPGQDEP